MGFVEWAQKMRKKPVEERRQFVVLSTIVITASIAVIWIVLFFTGVAKELKESRVQAEVKSKVPMTFNESKPSELPLPEF